MTKRQATQLLHDIWGQGISASMSQLAHINQAATDGESPLETVLRVSECPLDFHSRGYMFRFDEVKQWAVEALAALPPDPPQRQGSSYV